MDVASMFWDTLWNFGENNPLGATITGGLIIGFLGWGAKKIKDTIDGNKIYKFLQNSQETSSFTYRTTEVISSDVKLPEARVEYLCSHHTKIKRNSAEKQSWRLI